MKCKLKEILVQKGLTITKVSNSTGISRTTLTFLINGKAKGIRFNTMETLCKELNVTPNDLFQIEIGEIKED